MKVIIIPARYESTRFPGKPLAKIHGQEMILHTVKRCHLTQGFDKIIVVTNHRDIQDCVESNGFDALFSKSEFLTGSDRVAWAANEIGADLVVNCQGDEPLINPRHLEKVLDKLVSVPSGWVTAHCKLNPRQLNDENSVKISVNHQSQVIDFKREVQSFASGKLWFKHIGIYGYSGQELEIFHHKPQTKEEVKLSLEQLRVWPERPFYSVEVEGESQSVDSILDIAKVEDILNKR